ncbi:chemotaxis protein CheW [Reinekea sp.]|jgi:chemotaxis signal transduction protein|uniref:chemotaxis protein CheW n=1 Tax=Reinekea sp. TaxID=1970455 RepID=UPI002A7FAE0D|nr:chemotaxis protein CheW [Reinekea sp.]
MTTNRLAPKRLILPSAALALLNAKTAPDTAVDRLEPDTASTGQRAAYFGLSYQRFGLLFDDRVNKELVDFENLRRLPNAPSWLQGFTNIRGAIIPVFDFNRLFGVQTDKGPKTLSRNYLLVIGKGSQAFALPLQEFPHKLSFTITEAQPDLDLAPVRLRPFIRHCFRQDRPWFSIDHHAFLQDLKTQA